MYRKVAAFRYAERSWVSSQQYAGHGKIKLEVMFDCTLPGKAELQTTVIKRGEYIFLEGTKKRRNLRREDFVAEIKILLNLSRSKL